MDTVNGEIWLSFVFAKVTRWGVPEFILAVLTLIAAWRHKRIGIWLLAVAALLTSVMKVWLAILVSQGSTGPSSLQIVSYPGFVALLFSIAGWSALAFGRAKTAKSDTQQGAAP